MSGMPSGYKQVEEFGPDEDYEEEVEECYVTLDLGNADPTLLPSSSSYRLIGLDTPTPFLQLSGTIFKGKHETLLGTELLFTDNKDDPDKSKKHVTHAASTERRIRFREVELRPHDPPETETAQKENAHLENELVWEASLWQDDGSLDASVNKPKARKGGGPRKPRARGRVRGQGAAEGGGEPASSIPEPPDPQAMDTSEG